MLWFDSWPPAAPTPEGRETQEQKFKGRMGHL